MLELGHDYYTHEFGKKISNEIFEMLPHECCNFCGTRLNPDKASFYQHAEGWQTSAIKEKIWIWFTCPHCGQQWGINHLGFKRSEMISLSADLEIISQFPEILISQARESSDKIRINNKDIHEHLNNIKNISKLPGGI